MLGLNRYLPVRNERIRLRGVFLLSIDQPCFGLRGLEGESKGEDVAIVFIEGLGRLSVDVARGRSPTRL
jgi:hypothetical protein